MQNKTNHTKAPSEVTTPHILWLASWYPTQTDPLLGDFIQRQAKAAAILQPIVVWTFTDDPDGLVTQSTKRVVTHGQNIEENILYIFTGNWKNKPGYKYYKVIKILYHGWRALTEYYRKKPKPLAIHTHIVMYAGLLGHRLAGSMAIPHIISEQWTAYLPEAIPNIASFNPWSKRQLARVFKGAAAVTAVSQYLLHHLQKLATGKPMHRIPNVVDGELFFPGNPGDVPVFLCISAHAYQKNLEHVLDAVQSLKTKAPHQPFLLQIIHHPDEKLHKQVTDRNIADRVVLLPPGSHSRVAQYMRGAHALLLYSRYETFGCVVIEAQSCGLPVIGADIPVLRELINHGHNGILVPPENPESLANAMQHIMGAFDNFNKEAIRTTALKSYSYEQVALQYRQLYQSLHIIG